MSISTHVNVQLLSEYFDLSPFNDLKKESSATASNESGETLFLPNSVKLANRGNHILKVKMI